jgi:hypothetical protein
MKKDMQSPAQGSGADLLQPSQPWWREPFMALVVGGPVLVILACAFTIGLALKYPDRVLDTRTPARVQDEAHKGHLGVMAHQPQPDSAQQAAMQARNQGAGVAHAKP